jgi:hypothetical protein
MKTSPPSHNQENFLELGVGWSHRLNMELDLQSLFGLHAQLYSFAETPQQSPPHLRIWAHIRERYWSAKIDDIFL